MKSIKFKEEEYDCPESWDDCTLGMMIQTQILDDILPLAPIVSVVSGYVGIPSQDLALAKAREVKPFLECLSFINKPYVPRSSNSFVYSGETYSAPENLTDLRFDQWVSAQTVLYNYRESPVKGLPKILASLCVKTGESMADIDLEARGQLFYQLPFTTAKDVEGFFLDSLREYEAYSQLSSIVSEQEKLIPKQLTEVRNILKQRKVDPTTSWLTKRVIGMYQNYLGSFQKNWEKYYNSSPIVDSKTNTKKISRK